MTEPPATITYASVVSRELVMISLTLAALNDLPVKVADTQNAYITAHVTKKIQTVPVQEFSECAGRKAILVRALYGLNSAVGTFWNNLEN